MQKVFKVTINRKKFSIDYDAAYYDSLSKYDGKYVFETTVSKETLNKEKVRETYKRLQLVEHAFKDIKTDKIKFRTNSNTSPCILVPEEYEDFQHIIMPMQL